MATFMEHTNVVTPANWIPGPKQGEWDYSAYAALPNDGQRYGVVEGVLYVAPAPGTFHQNIVGEIYHQLRQHIKVPGLGIVFMAPTDVELTPVSIVQPDVLVVLKGSQAQIIPTRVIGAPDLVVEVSSSSTAGYDRREKQDAYQRAGVREYWLVDSNAQTIEVLFLQDGVYQSQGFFGEQHTLPSRIVPSIDDVAVAEFFQ